jgi:hypothetical protein
MFSAVHPITDIARCGRHVRKVPTAEVAAPKRMLLARLASAVSYWIFALLLPGFRRKHSNAYET